MDEPMVKFPQKMLEIQDWGSLPYGVAYKRQNAFVEKRIDGNAQDRLVLVEHPPVVTIGRSGGLQDLRISEDALLQKGIALHRVDRGGMATFHGPGQMVAYPILELKTRDLHTYLQKLQETLATVLRIYGLRPRLHNGKPGVWVDSAKVASIGIAVRKWVTYHGVALNVNTDPRWFNWIIPCGHPNEKITSMERELGHPLDMCEVKETFIRTFCTLFGYPRPYDDQGRSSKHPGWLIQKAPSREAIDLMEERLLRWRLATVCQRAHCPNLGECFTRGTATFMILGTRCTRRCRFCAVDKGAPQQVDPEEPERVACMVQALDLKYVVITSVTRDDLPDGGARQFVRTMKDIRTRCDRAKVEVLVPDFRGSLAALQKVCEARPDMFTHNIETVERLYPHIRPHAEYLRSLSILEYAARQGIPVKSGLMLGLGETEQEVVETFIDLKRTGCYYLTIGQYLAPSRDHVPVARYVPPDEFERWAETARSMGFRGVASAPLVRSSYRAEEMLKTEKRDHTNPS